MGVTLAIDGQRIDQMRAALTLVGKQRADADQPIRRAWPPAV